MKHARAATALLFAVSCGLSPPAAEIVLRTALDEVNYLKPRRVAHPVLPWVVAPGSGGHDAWGFRNRRVPERVEIVAIGDSHTYGVSATADGSWPAQLGAMSGRSVYNLALGGYGPQDYRHLFESRAVKLSPQVVVIGTYLGNDLPRAAEVGSPPAPLAPARDNRALGGLRSWLARHSVLYQALKLEVPALANALRFREVAREEREGVVVLEHPIAATAFAPRVRLDALDPSRAKNRLGLARTREILGDIDERCRARALTCLHLLIPTKESVYADLAAECLDAAGRAQIEAVARAEARVRDELVRFFDANGMAWIDPLPDLRAAVESERLYPANRDGHPNGAGYRIVARAVHRKLASTDERFAIRRRTTPGGS